MKLKKELKLSNRTHKVYKILQDTTNNSELVNIGLTESQSCFSLPEKKGFLWKTKIPKGKYWFGIELIGQDTIKNGNTDAKSTLTKSHFRDCPISFIISNASRSSSGVFEVWGSKTNFTIFFDVSKLKDCPNELNEKRTFYLPFQLTIKNIINGQPQDQNQVQFEDYMIIEVDKYMPHLNFKFEPIRSNLVYSSVNPQYIKVGTLHVSHSADYSCAPIIENASFSMTSLMEGDDDKKTEHHDRIYISEEDMRVVEKRGLHFAPGETKSFDVVLDMKCANNPHNDKDIYKVMINYNDKTESCGEFQLDRNKTITSAKVTFEYRDSRRNNIQCDITEKNEVEVPLLLLNNTKQDVTYPMNICFTNTADAIDESRRNAAVLVWDVKLEVGEVEGGEINTNGEELKKLFGNSYNGPWALTPKNERIKSFTIEIKASQIKSITPSQEEDETFAVVPLKISYYVLEDKNGDQYTYERGKITIKSKNTSIQSKTIKIRLKKNPNPKWLCVDFGTSAVVALGGIKIDKYSLYNLNETKEKLLKNVYSNENDKPKIQIIDEESGCLISSVACFNPQNNAIYDNIEEDGNNYRDLPLWFSPSASDLHKDYLLPCLKTIIGYDVLPRIFNDSISSSFEYSIEQGRTTKLFEDDKPTPLRKVQKVTEIIYRQLFSYYLAKTKCNKLVLSVPNSFTPLNIEAVKKLARKVMPNIYPEYLRTISESDAVACYYIMHNEKFINNGELEEDTKEKIKKHEQVLVFDMGAGTLDITWFEKTEENGQTVVDIKGKLGVNKAGNYLDYKIGCILAKIFEKKLINKTESDKLKLFNNALLYELEKANENVAGNDLRIELKKYIIQLKKNLHENVNLPQLVLQGNKYPQINANEILQHNDKELNFKKVISEMTEEVLETFYNRYKDDGLDIDVVIFSGRSTILKEIRENVKQTIDKKHVNKKILYADICSDKLLYGIDFKYSDNSTKLKTIVAEGALAYVTLRNEKTFKLNNKPFYASFGLILHGDGLNKYKYIPLIDNSMSAKDNKIESDSVPIDPQSYGQIDLIQSYSDDPVEDYKQKKFDTISKLYTRYIEDNEYEFSVKLKMILNPEDEVSLEFSDAQGIIRMDAHDDFDNDSLRKSLWPVVFNINKE